MRGGKRPNAGRPKGAVNVKTQERVAAIEESGLTPLDYMIQLRRNEALDFATRLDAAKAAAPYVHPRLTSVEHKGDEKHPLGLIVTSGVPRASGD